MVGWPDKLWLVNDGNRQLGPYTTERLVELLRAGQVDWLWRIWRDGMKTWTPAAQLFTIPELSPDHDIRLRDFIHLNEYQPRQKKS